MTCSASINPLVSMQMVLSYSVTGSNHQIMLETPQRCCIFCSQSAWMLNQFIVLDGGVERSLFGNSIQSPFCNDKLMEN